MFETFQSRYSLDFKIPDLVIVPSDQELLGFSDFIAQFGGSSFANGLYRVVTPSSIAVWNGRVGDAFPAFAGRVTCFAYDWLGRAFALDRNRFEEEAPAVTLFEPGTGEALEIPCNLHTFHTDELLDFGEAALAISFFEQWTAAGGAAPGFSECIGYKRPLFLGGADEVDNLELSDIDVYWHLSGQMLKKVRGLPPGTAVNIT